MDIVKSILLVEDDDLDATTVKRAIRDLHITNPVMRATNGEDALAWLEKANGRPGLILLDLDMPVMNGIEFLKAIKAHEQFKGIPVVILTSSDLEEDRVATFDLSVAGYMVKPIDYQQFVETVRTMSLYWTLSETL